MAYGRGSNPRQLDFTITANTAKFTRALSGASRSLLSFGGSGRSSASSMASSFNAITRGSGSMARGFSSAARTVIRSQDQMANGRASRAQIAQMKQAAAVAKTTAASQARAAEQFSQRKIVADRNAANSLRALNQATARWAAASTTATREERRLAAAENANAQRLRSEATRVYNEAAAAARRTANEAKTAENAFNRASNSFGGGFGSAGAIAGVLGGVTSGVLGLAGSLASLGVRVGAGVFDTIAAGAQVAAKGVTGVTLAVTGLGTALAADIFHQGLTRTLDIQDAKQKLKSLGNDAKSVKEIMSNAQQAVVGTRFALNEGVTAAATAVAAGVKPGKQLTSYLQTFSDLAQVANTSIADISVALTDAQASGRVYKRDLMQLASRGVPIFPMLQKQYKVTGAELGKMVHDGQITFSGLMATLQNSNIFGAAGAGANTARGAFQNMQAALGRLGETFLDTPVAGAPKLFKKIIKMVDGAAASLEPLSKRFSAFTKDLFGKGSKLIDSFDVSQITGAFETALNVAKAIAPVVGAALSSALTIAGQVATAVGKFATSDSFLSLTDTLQGALEGATPVVGTFIDMIESGFEGVAPIIGSIASGISQFLQPALETAGPLISQFGSWFQGVFSENNIFGFFSVVGTLFENLVTQASDFSTALKDPKMQEAIGNIGKALLWIIDPNTWGPAVISTFQSMADIINTIAVDVDAISKSALFKETMKSPLWAETPKELSTIDKVLNGQYTTTVNTKDEWAGIYNYILRAIDGTDRLYNYPAKNAVVDHMEAIGKEAGAKFGSALGAEMAAATANLGGGGFGPLSGTAKGGIVPQAAPKTKKAKSAIEQAMADYNRIMGEWDDKIDNSAKEAAEKKKADAAAKRAREAAKRAAEALAEFRTTTQQTFTEFLSKIGSATVSDIKSKINTLKTAVKSAFTKGYITKGVYQTLSDTLRTDNKRLQTLATQREKITQKIKDANKMVTDIKDGVKNSANVTSGGTFTDIRRQLQNTLAATNGFSTVFGQLKSQGLNSTALNQLIQQFISDPKAGYASAQAILRAGKGGVNQINSLQKQIAAKADTFAHTAADTIYDSGKGAADGFLTGLKSRKLELSNQMIDLGNTLANTVGKALGVTVTNIKHQKAAAVAATKTSTVKPTAATGKKKDTGGSVTINLTVHAGLGTNSATLGKQLVEHIDKHIKSGGKSVTLKTVNGR